MDTCDLYFISYLYNIKNGCSMNLDDIYENLKHYHLVEKATSGTNIQNQMKSQVYSRSTLLFQASTKNKVCFLQLVENSRNSDEKTCQKFLHENIGANCMHVLEY